MAIDITYTSIVASRTMMGKDRDFNEVLFRIDGLGGEKELAKLSIHFDLHLQRRDFFLTRILIQVQSRIAIKLESTSVQDQDQ